MDKKEGLAKRIEDACGKVGVNIQGLGLENLIESSKSVAEKIPNEIEISYRYYIIVMNYKTLYRMLNFGQQLDI